MNRHSKKEMGADLREELNGPGEGRCASNQDGTLCTLHHRPNELGSLGAVGLQGMALVTHHHSKAAAIA